MITEQQYRTMKQPERELHCKVNLLNYKFQIVDDISGVVLSDSWNISATSDIRRTGTIVIVPDDTDAYKIQAGSKIFLDKYVQVYIGIKDVRTDEIIYNNMGIYLINNPQHTFDSATNQITLNLIDLMSKLTGLRNGNLNGYEYQLKEGQDVREVIIAVLAEVGFTNYAIEIDADDYQTVQFDMSVNGDSTLYDILKTLNNNQYVNYQMYFDVDGCFHFNRIPMGVHEQVACDDDIWNRAYLSHNVTTDYESLKNSIVVMGKTHDSTKYSSDCALNDHTFEMTSASVKREMNHIKLAFTTPSDLTPTTVGEQYYLNLNNYGSFPIKDANGRLTGFNFEPNEYYVVKLQNFIRQTASLSGLQNATTYTIEQKFDENPVGWYISKSAKSLQEAITEGVTITAYDEENLTITVSSTLSPQAGINGRLFYVFKNDTTNVFWEFMGQYQPRAEIKETNPASPFYVNGSVGEIKISLMGGEYDNISTDLLALERAKWELYTRCRLLDSIDIVALPIYWLDVNQLIRITLPTESEPKDFIVKGISIQGGVTGTMTINAMTYYPFYDPDYTSD